MLDLDDLPEAVEAQVVAPTEIGQAPPVSLAKTKADHLRRIEDDLLQESMGIVRDVLHFSKIDPDAEEPPAEWVNELGRERAIERLRTAKYGILSAKEAPVGIKVAQSVATSIVKARATEKAGPRSLNIVQVQMTAPLPTFRRLEVEK